jgi:hypothetical protein
VTNEYFEISFLSFTSFCLLISIGILQNVRQGRI